MAVSAITLGAAIAVTIHMLASRKANNGINRKHDKRHSLVQQYSNFSLMPQAEPLTTPSADAIRRAA
jgi:hypothetical protein